MSWSQLQEGSPWQQKQVKGEKQLTTEVMGTTNQKTTPEQARANQGGETVLIRCFIVQSILTGEENYITTGKYSDQSLHGIRQRTGKMPQKTYDFAQRYMGVKEPDQICSQKACG